MGVKLMANLYSPISWKSGRSIWLRAAMAASSPQLLTQSISDTKLFWFPLQPPYTNSLQRLCNWQEMLRWFTLHPWKRLYLNIWVHYFHQSHFLNELPLIQNMMLVNSKLPKTFEIFTQTSDFVFFPMVPPLHICWNTDGRLIESGVLFCTILLHFT